MPARPPSNARSSWIKPALLTGLLLLLSGCGGGGGGGGGSDTTTSPPAPTQPNAPAAPSIATQPADAAVDDGQPASFVVAANSTLPVSYQWQRDGVAIAGATAATYRIERTVLNDDGARFTVTIASTAGNVTSSEATLQVRTIAPAIGTHPQERAVLVGETATFSVVATGSEPLQFQWLKNGVPIAGATTATYTTAPTGLLDLGTQYNVVVTNAAGSAISATALLLVTQVAVAPSITTQPINVTRATGDAAVFAVTTTGTLPFHYQWKRNGVDIPGATQPTYTVSPVSILANGSRYSVTVSNAAGSVDSQQAELTVVGAAIDLIAGAPGGSGNLDGIGAAARMNSPHVKLTDAAGNIYFVDTWGSLSGSTTKLRKLAPDGLVTTLFDIEHRPIAGPDANGNLYLGGFCLIQKISPLGVITDIAGDPTLGTFCGYLNSLGDDDGVIPTAMVLAPNGDLYFTDENHTIRKLAPDGQVTTIAGEVDTRGSVDGTGAAAHFEDLHWIDFDAAGDLIVIEERFGSHQIRKVSLAGVVTSLSDSLSGYTGAGGTPQSFDIAPIMAADGLGNFYVKDSGTRYAKVSPTGSLLLMAGGSQFTAGQVDGPAGDARFYSILSIKPDGSGGAVISDNFTIKKVDAAGNVSTIAGQAPRRDIIDGPAAVSRFNQPQSIAFDSEGNAIVASNNSIRKIAPDGQVSTIAGDGFMSGSADGVGWLARFNKPRDIAIDSQGNLFIADSGNNAIRKIEPNGQVTTFAGGGGAGHADGVGSAAEFSRPAGIAIDANDDVYVADTGNAVIRKISPSGSVTTLAGAAGSVGDSDGTLAAARFKDPEGIAVDASGNLYVADTGNHTIREITTGGIVNTIAGSAGVDSFSDGSSALFRSPTSLIVDAAGDLYVADSNNHAIRKISGGIVTTVAGQPDAAGSHAGSIGVKLGGLPGSLNGPTDVALVPSGPNTTLAVIDILENVILSITLP